MGESFEMRIYDHEFQVSDTHMRKMLHKAALQEHGFKLEITTKMMAETGTGSDEPVYQKTHYYYKIVDCSKVPEVSQQVEALIQGKKEKKQFTSRDSQRQGCPSSHLGNFWFHL